MKAYVLIETAAGVVPYTVDALKAVQGVVSVTRVTGPYDVMAIVETTDLGALGRLVEEEVHTLPGIRKTVTCVAIAK